MGNGGGVLLIFGAMVPPGCWIQLWHETSGGISLLGFSLEALTQRLGQKENLTEGQTLAVIKMKNFICTKHHTRQFLNFDFCKDASSLQKS